MLYNQFRPRKFEDYISKDTGAAEYIKAVIKSNLHPSAALLSGMPGSGKSVLAQLYARATLCPNRAEGTYEPCGECEVCLGDNKDNITHYVVRDATEAKEAFQELINVANSAPHTTTKREDQYRRFIILDEIQNCSKQAISTLLDPLEFSPPSTTWILISMDLERLDPILREAIESRSKEISLRPLSTESISSILTSRYRELDEQAAISIAKFSNGNMRRAWSLLEYFLTMMDVKLITEEVIVKEKGGGATNSARYEMWDYFYSGNTEEVYNLVKGWVESCDPNLIAFLLIQDCCRGETNSDKIGIIKTLSYWMQANYKAPLYVIMSAESFKYKTTYKPKPSTLPIVSQPSASIQSDFQSVIAKFKPKSSIFDRLSFKDIWNDLCN